MHILSFLFFFYFSHFKVSWVDNVVHHVRIVCKGTISNRRSDVKESCLSYLCLFLFRIVRMCLLFEFKNGWIFFNFNFVVNRCFYLVKVHLQNLIRFLQEINFNSIVFKFFENLCLILWGKFKERIHLFLAKVLKVNILWRKELNYMLEFLLCFCLRLYDFDVRDGILDCFDQHFLIFFIW